MPYLQSDTIEAVSYDDKVHLLKIKFRVDGHVIVYENVPQEIYDSRIVAERKELVSAGCVASAMRHP